MAKFRIATPAGASFTVAGGGYGYEMEALTPIEAEIYEVKAGSEDEFVAAARHWRWHNPNRAAGKASISKARCRRTRIA